MRIRNYILITALLGVLGGCCRKYVCDAENIVKAADWSTMETISVGLSEYAFSPSELALKTGKPYKLEIKNEGTVKHYFVSEGFFKAIATRKLQSNSDGEIKAPYFTAIEVFPGRSLYLIFYSGRKGKLQALMHHRRARW